jgi:hypothetical protein
MLPAADATLPRIQARQRSLRAVKTPPFLELQMNAPQTRHRHHPLAARALLAVLAATLVLAPSVGHAQQQARVQPVDAEYTAKIREFTTEPFFLTPHVDHLPASSTVPTPLAVLGRIAGAADVLSYPDEIYRYMRAVAAASPRVQVITIGHTEEGREMIVVAVGEEQTIASLEQYRTMLGQLADPRRTNAEEAARIISRAKPVYWATGAIHSPETGSPEMLMELVYRLAVDEGPFIKAIRDSMIVMITPVVEVDGRAKQVDIHMARRKDPNANVPNGLLFWGQYVAHDNNRDGMGLSLKLTQNIMSHYLRWNPTVLHDLHESASYLYTSTGRGPYNPWIDPITINEWNRLAYKEVGDMTAMGVPGVYTYDFYDGWAPNYMFWIANMRNSIGRFYETQGSGNAATRLLTTNVERQWHRPNTPLRQVMWSIRNNVNLQQSAILIAMNEVATRKTEYLNNFYTKSRRSVAKATAEGPAAYVFPADDPRPGQQARLLSLFQRHGIEVHRTTSALSAEGQNFAAGSYVVRMDQPFSRTADMMLDRQYYNANDPRPYDDAGWTHGPLFNVQTVRVEDASVLRGAMTLVSDTVQAEGGITGPANSRAYLVNNNADNNLAAFRYAHPDLNIAAAQQAFTAGGREFNAGSLIISSGNGGNLRTTLDAATRRFGFTAHGVGSAPSVPTHPLRAARIAVMHTWQTTQTEGWMRIALDEYGIPYDYISVHAVRDDENLRGKYDVILFGPSQGDALNIVRGLTGARPLPWEATPITPNLGKPTSTPDMRGGLEFSGVMNLQRFVEEGGTLVTIGNSSSLPIHFGFAPGVSIRQTQDLWAPGGVYRTQIAESGSPITYGYGSELGVYLRQGPVFAGGGGGMFAGGGGGGGRGGGGGGGGAAASAADPGATTARRSGRGGPDDQDIVQGRARDMGTASVQGARGQGAGPAGGAGGGAGGGGRGGAGRGAGAGAAPATPAPAAGEDDPPAASTRTVVRFNQDPRALLISGGLTGAQELAGAPAVVHSTMGNGNIVMFSFNPFWRGGTLGSYALVFNTMMNYEGLARAGR